MYHCRLTLAIYGQNQPWGKDLKSCCSTSYLLCVVKSSWLVQALIDFSIWITQNTQICIVLFLLRNLSWHCCRRGCAGILGRAGQSSVVWNVLGAWGSCSVFEVLSLQQLRPFSPVPRFPTFVADLESPPSALAVLSGSTDGFGADQEFLEANLACWLLVPAGGNSALQPRLLAALAAPLGPLEQRIAPAKSPLPCYCSSLSCVGRASLRADEAVFKARSSKLFTQTSPFQRREQQGERWPVPASLSWDSELSCCVSGAKSGSVSSVYPGYRIKSSGTVRVNQQSGVYRGGWQ